ncbi:hypothetical protein BC332_20251 [Capsicum chinense]|nr:hypothetical protein BC332_20251 [Capsicum chinense]
MAKQFDFSGTSNDRILFELTQRLDDLSENKKCFIAVQIHVLNFWINPEAEEATTTKARGAFWFFPQLPCGDVVSKIMTILDQGPPAVCILSGAGSLCEVTLWDSAIGTVIHEVCGLNLAMTRPDVSLFGGVVEGKLRAATPVQVVVRSVFPDTEKLKSKQPASTPPPNELNFGPPPVTKATSPSTPSSTHLM